MDETGPLAFLQLYHEERAAVRAELQAGLLADQARVSPKYFYNPLGSRLFDAITELPEYYLTRTEARIFDRYRHEIAAAVPQGATLIDLGAGNCAKASRLFDSLRPSAYVAVDISVDFVRCALNTLRERCAGMAMMGLGMDFSSRLQLPVEVERFQQGLPDAAQARVLFYPGSSIGNFDPDEASRFLSDAFAACQRNGQPAGGLLIGVDLLKAVDILEPAYDDALGVTAAFNLNLLSHLNHLLEADFDPRQWRHVAFFNADRQRIEMHLEARESLCVRWPGGKRKFGQGERIHTECSYKWRRSGFEHLLLQAGFSRVRCWTDEQGWFAVFWAEA